MRYWKLLNSLTLSDPVIWVLQSKRVMDWVLTCQTSCLNILFRKLAKVSMFVWRNQLIRAIIPKSIVSVYVCIHVHVGQARACLCMCVCLIDMYTCACDCRYTVCAGARGWHLLLYLSPLTSPLIFWASCLIWSSPVQQDCRTCKLQESFYLISVSTRSWDLNSQPHACRQVLH